MKSNKISKEVYKFPYCGNLTTEKIYLSEIFIDKTNEQVLIILFIVSVIIGILNLGECEQQKEQFENKIFPFFSVFEPPTELPMMNLNIWSDKYKFSYKKLEKIQFTTKQKNQLYSNISHMLKGEINLETMIIDLKAIKELKFNKPQIIIEFLDFNII